MDQTLADLTPKYTTVNSDFASVIGLCLLSASSHTFSLLGLGAGTFRIFRSSRASFMTKSMLVPKS